MEKIGEKMYQRIRDYILDNHMIEEGMTVLAGVSGGADSMTMLALLRQFCKEQAAVLRVVHVNHGIRGEEALEDQKLVEQTCHTWQIPCRVYSYSVPELAKEYKKGEEEMGRLVRGHAFDQEIKGLKEEPEKIRIALAHNQQDQAETVLHNLARGTGIRGLAGILPVSGNRIRPILCLNREEIVNYLKEIRIPYAEDSSNQSDLYTRNRIRHHIIPVLKDQVNGQAVRHIAGMASIAAKTEQYLEGRGKELLRKCRREKDRIYLEQEFSRAPEMEQLYAVLLGMEQLAGKRRDITSGHVESVWKLLSLPVGKRRNLPYGIQARRTYDGICLELRGSREEEKNDREMERVLELSGEELTGFASEGFFMRVFSCENEKIEEKKYTKWLDYDKIDKTLTVRTRRTGDYMIVRGDGTRKKITRVMIDDKIPLEIRDSIPLIACENEILWITGGRLNERYKVTAETKRVLEIQYQGGKM